MLCIFADTSTYFTQQTIKRKTFQKPLNELAADSAATNVFFCTQITTSVGADDVDRLAATWQRTSEWQQMNEASTSCVCFAATVVFVAGHVLWRLFNWESFFLFIQFSLRSLLLFIICCCYLRCDYKCVATCLSWANERYKRKHWRADGEMEEIRTHKRKARRRKTGKFSAFYRVVRTFSSQSVRLCALVKWYTCEIGSFYVSAK